MIRDLFSSLKGIENYGIISTLIFLGFFIMLIFYVVSMKKSETEEYSRMPFDDSIKKSDEIQDI